MVNIKGILVSIVAPMSNHIANGGEKLLGNASSIKRRNDGKVYISGQMQRHVLFSAINRLNEEQKNSSENICDEINQSQTFVSNGDGISNKIEVDLRADMGGFMHPSAGSYSGRRTAPLTVTPAVAMSQSQITRDLLVRMKIDQADGSRDQALATKEQSDSDLMIMNFFLDISSLSISNLFSYDGGFHVKTEYVKHVTEEERIRRVKLFLEATRSMTDFANQARNATTGEPQKVLIALDNKMSRKGVRYFEANQTERSNIIKEIESRNAKHFIGDDTTKDSVELAYKNACNEIVTLYDPTNNSNEIKSFSATFESNTDDNS